jgi:hypothetical protein
MAFKFTIVLVLLLVASGCSSRGAAEVGCNFVSGATFIEYDEDSSWESNFFSDIFVGLLNVVAQGAHRNVSPDTYSSCAKPDKATCIDSDGNIKEECTLTN